MDSSRDFDPQTPAQSNLALAALHDELSPPEITRWNKTQEKYPELADNPKERKRREFDLADQDFSLEEFGDPFDEADMVEKL